MVISDFVIISPKQLFAKLPKNFDLIIETCNRNVFPKTVYVDGFHIAQRVLRGIWYTIYPGEEKLYTDAFFDLEINNGMSNVVIRSDWINVIDELIDFFLEKSPDHTIVVLLRLDYPNCEMFHKHQSRDEFCDKMKKNQLHFDEMYFVSK